MDPQTTQVNEAATEIDGDILMAEAYAEMDGTEPPVRKKEEPEAQPAPEQKEEGDPEPVQEDEAKPEGTEEAKPAAEEEKEGEEKAPATDAPSKSEDEIIQDHAIKNGMTYSEAKEDIEATKAVLKNYKTPEEIARALRSTQSEYSKLKSQVEQKPKPQIFQRVSDGEFIARAKQFYSVNEKEKEKDVQAFRQRFPEHSELLTDGAIVEQIIDRSLSGYRASAEKQESELVKKAAERREQLLTSVAETDKRFLPDVKKIIVDTSDAQVLNEGFDIKDIVYWAKGQRYDPDIKAAEERGYTRGKEESKILGMKTGTGGGGAPKSSKGSTDLTQAQQRRAVEMFPDGTPEEAYKSFKEVHADDLKTDPHFLY